MLLFMTLRIIFWLKTDCLMYHMMALWKVIWEI